MKKKLFTLLTLLLCLCSTAWATDPIIWNLEKNYSSTSTEPECEGTVNNWSALSSSVYTYQKALSNAPLLNQAGDANFSLTDGLTFTCAAKKLQLGKGYLYFNEDASHGFSVPTTAGQYVNLVIGIGNTGATTSVTGGDITSISFPTTTKAYSVNIRATGNKLTITTNKKLYIYQIAVIDESDVVAPVVPNYGEGSYYKGLSLSLSTETEGASIVYKNDSQTRGFGDLSSYSSAISMTNTGKRYVTTCATRSVTGGKLYSDLKTYIYTIEGTLPAPVATPAAGTYNSTQNVVLSVENMLPNGVIRYTTNGNTPSSSSPAYTDPIEVSADKTIKAYLFESTGNSQKSSMLTAAYTIVSLTDPSFSLSATTIPSNSTAQIKVGSNAGLDGVTLSNIAYGTNGIVTVNASTGVVTPVASGTTTITFDTEATTKYNASTGNELTITVTTPKCATPTITVDNKFNFENKGYAVTITNNEDGSTLYYSTNNVDWTEYTSALYATTTTHYYAKSVKASYDDSDVADKNVTNTFDSEKKYIAWVYKSGYTSASVAYNFETDPMVIGLKTTYNVVPVALADNDKPYTNCATDGWAIDKSDLVVCTEAVTGNTDLANDMENFVGRNAMINLKLWNYGGNQTRWGWGTPANNTSSFTFTPTSTLYKVLNGVTFENGAVKVFESTAPKDNKLAYVTWSNEPTNNVNMGSVSGKTTMHAIIDDANLKKQFFAFGLSRDNATSYTANAVTIIKNAAAMLIAGTERLDAEVATVSGTITEAGWNTFSSSYALDLYTISGGTAYVATTTSDKSVTMSECKDIVEAGTGLMIKGTDGATFTINTTSSAATFNGENLLVGLPNGGTVTKNDNNYVFAWPTATPSDYGFYFVNDYQPTLPAGKAYLHTTAPHSKQLAIVFEGETTGISNLNVNNNDNIDANAPMYNLAGQKVSKNYKGIVIVNGKKVVRK